jgi:hypothetical protein
MPHHSTLSRTFGKDSGIQVNGEKVVSSAVPFLGEEFVRITETEGEMTIHTYDDWDKIPGQSGSIAEPGTGGKTRTFHRSTCCSVSTSICFDRICRGWIPSLRP